MAYIEGQDRNQTVLFPERIDDYISNDSVVLVIEEYVEQLDLLKLKFTKAVCPKLGRPPYNPKDLLKLYIYGYLNRVRSSRRLEQEATRNIEVIWLLKKLKPDFKTIADFRKDNKKALKAVFREFTKLCNDWDLFGKELVAIDGSKFRACNAKKNNFSDKKLKRQLNYIDEKIDKYMQELDETDTAESSDRKPDTEEIRKRIEELRERKHKYETYQKELEDTGANEISTTDPDARLMANNNNNVDVSYNVQTTVDAKHKLVVDFKVTQKPNDLGELDNMALRAKKVLNIDELEALADKGYYKVEDLKKCVEHGVTPYVSKQIQSNTTGDRDFYSDRFTYNKEKDVYLCPAGKELTRGRTRKIKGQITGFDYRNFKACKLCSFKAKCTKSAKGRAIFRHKDQDFLDTINIQTELNMDKYKQRQMIVEHPFGTIKRVWGAYYFLTRRKASVIAEMSLTFLAYNMRRAINILGAKEIIKRLRERRAAVMA
jgi:transposase